MTIFLRVLEVPVNRKAEVLLEAIRSLRNDQGGTEKSRVLFELDPAQFSAVAGTPFAYWLSARTFELFRQSPRFESEARTARVGLQTSDDTRFVRLWTEVMPSTGQKWHSFAKGGRLSPYYADVSLVVTWECNGREMKAYAETTAGTTHWSRKLPNSDLYGRPGITWPLRASRFCPQALFAGSVFSIRGSAAFVPERELTATLAIFNSSTFDYLFKTTLGRFGFPEFAVGTLQTLPWIAPKGEQLELLARLGRRAWSLRRQLHATRETSHAFVLPSGLYEGHTGRNRQAVEADLVHIQTEIDSAVFELFSISHEDRATIEMAASRPAEREISEDFDDADAGIEEAAADAEDALLSWLVGVVFGRFDPRLAKGERAIPSEGEPFDALPSCSPGMWPEGEKPAKRIDIFVDDEGHGDDLPAHVRSVAEGVHVEMPENLRGWLAKEFFSLHIKMYSKSRRRAPIYWQLATRSAVYSVWLYIHAFSKDTLFRVQNDYAAPKLAHEERRLDSLTSQLRDGATAAQRKALAAQQSVVEELRAFLDEVKRVAPLWSPKLDDGVVINFAPLWRLVPQNKAWQKELKSTWDALGDAKYEWAHLAMHLWPERVIPKCAQDRSLAIAHGLQDVFWVEGDEGKWTARETPTRSLDELVSERTSPAVKSALKSLLEAPATTGSGRPGRGGPRKATVQEGDA